jgi:hypothetical protein
MEDTFLMIEKIKHRKNEIELFINTNLSTVKYKKIDIIKELSGFKKINFYISCDGFGKIGEYQRTGFKTKKFKENLSYVLSQTKDLKEFEVSFTYVISAINVFSIFEFIRELQTEFNISDNKIWLLFLSTPWYFSVRSENDEFKLKVINFINENIDNCGQRIQGQLNNFIYFIKNNNRTKTDEDKKDLEFITKIDNNRNTNIMSVAPWIITDIFNL